MIIQTAAGDKPALRFNWNPVRWRSVAVLLVAGLLMSGCGDDRSESAEKTDEQDTVAVPLRVDVQGWRDFDALTTRIFAGDLPTPGEINDLGRSESFRAWSDCLPDHRPDAVRIGNWLTNAFAPELGQHSPRKVNSDRLRMRTSYRYSRSQADKINAQLDDWLDPHQQKRFLTEVERWIEPERLPATLVVHFLPTMPELRYCDGSLVADTGVLAAGGNRQLQRQLIAMLYRNLQTMPPIEDPERPEAMIAQVWRDLVNEGVAAWIERAPFTFFAPSHPTLNEVALVPEYFYNNGVRSVETMERLLNEFLEQPRISTEDATEFRIQTPAGGTLTQAGYAMAATIVHHLGENRLIAVRGSLVQFLAAYQEAALRNPDPQPTPGQDDTPLPLSQKPFSPTVYQGLIDLLSKYDAQ